MCIFNIIHLILLKLWINKFWSKFCRIFTVVRRHKLVTLSNNFRTLLTGESPILAKWTCPKLTHKTAVLPLKQIRFDTLLSCFSTIRPHSCNKPRTNCAHSVCAKFSCFFMQLLWQVRTAKLESCQHHRTKNSCGSLRWYERDVSIEEKCFPPVFPKVVGG